MKRRLLTLGSTTAIAALSLGLMAAPVIAGGGSSTIWVDDDGHAGPNQKCGGGAVAAITIQAGVDASNLADTVLVCPGTYGGAVVIEGPTHDWLTVRSVERGQAKLVATNTEFAVFIVDADHVRILGFQLVAPTAAPCVPMAGMIFSAESDGTVIRNNVIRPAGTDTLGDCGYERGIWVEFGAGVVVRGNIVRDFKHTGIFLGSSSGVVIENSIRFYHAAEASIERQGNGITFAFGAWQVNGNRVIGLTSAGATSPLLNTGIFPNSTEPGQLVLRNNVIERTGVGMLLASVRGALVFDNTMRFDVDLDCYDTSTGGSGTAGTDNTWVDNVGDPAKSFPAGVCSLP